MTPDFENGLTPGGFMALKPAYYLLLFSILAVGNSLLISDIRHGLNLPPFAALLSVTTIQVFAFALLDSRDGQ